MKRQALSLITILILLSLTISASHAKTPAADEGQAYIVQAGDSLQKIAQTFYNSSDGWRAIVEATNQQADSDPSFAHITNPDLIQVGQKLWIPASSEDTPTPTPAPEPTPPPGGEGSPACVAKLGAAYCAAVKDAETADASEISRDLIPIAEWNTKLSWRGEPGSKQLLVVTWTSYAGYDTQVAQTITTTRETWVTAVPELRSFCQEYQQAHPEGVTLRLEQRLGVPANSGKNRFVEFWVRPSDLFRPAPDPEVSDYEAQSTGFYSPTLRMQPARPTSPFVTVSQAYIEWFSNLEASSYTAETPYPWTRLGYTYDWGSPGNEVGASEFVIRKDAAITVNKVFSNEDYCKI